MEEEGTAFPRKSEAFPRTTTVGTLPVVFFDEENKITQ